MKEWGAESGRVSTALLWGEFALLISPVALIVAALVAASWPSAANAHPGGLAADGCHNDRKNGGRHCHQGNNAGRTLEQPRNGAVYYANCDAARRAGATPILRGQPGYGTHLDRDGDGKACE